MLTTIFMHMYLISLSSHKLGKFFWASMGFELVASTFALQCSTNCTMKTHTSGARQKYKLPYKIDIILMDN